MTDQKRAHLKAHFTRVMLGAARRLAQPALVEPWQRTLCRKTIYSCLRDLTALGYGGEAILVLRALRAERSQQEAA